MVAATESLVVQILNETFPRVEEDGRKKKLGHKIFRQSFAEVYANEKDESESEKALTRFFVDNDLNMVKQPSMLVDGYLEMAPATVKTVNTRKQAKKKKRQSQQLRRQLPLLSKTSNQNHRNLVYYTPLYPIEITDVEDVLDQACPAGVNCMKVFTTVEVVLEEGDDAGAVEEAIKSGVRDAFSDGSFFQVSLIGLLFL